MIKNMLVYWKNLLPLHQKQKDNVNRKFKTNIN